MLAALRYALPSLPQDVTRPITIDTNIHPLASECLHLFPQRVVIPPRDVGCPDCARRCSIDAGYRNPNGSDGDIAGVLSENRRVLGMMPHPERALDVRLGSADGLALFEGLCALEAA